MFGRFWQVLRFFHVCDPASELPNGDPNYDKLQKIRPLINLLGAAFKAEYDCEREITIDEAMIPYKGRIGYKQYMKDKPTKWGIKVCVINRRCCTYITHFFRFLFWRSHRPDTSTSLKSIREKRRLLLGNTACLRKSSWT